MNVHTLQNDSWQLKVIPQVGASIVGLAINYQNAWQPIMRPTPDTVIQQGNPSNYSSFTLAPFSNRLKDARFVFDGQAFQLRATSADGSTQHGDVRSRPWQVLEQAALLLCCRMDTRDVADMNFPFPFAITVTYTLEDDVFITNLCLENVGDSAMPAGFGVHPYFERYVAGSEEVQLSFEAETVFLTDENLIPTGETQVPPEELNFSRPRAVGKQYLNHGFQGWEGRASLHWPGIGRSVVFDCDSIFDHLVVFTHADGSLAVEPVTNAANGFNLFAQGHPLSGVQVLQPGAKMQGSVRLRLDAF